MLRHILIAGSGLVAVALAATTTNVSETFQSALALRQAKRYPEARAALEKVVAAEPNNAAAYHELGLIWKLRGDNAAFEQAVNWLAKAAALEPRNATYLGDYGGTSLQLAGRTHSPSTAMRGRDAMEKAIALDPEFLDAREGLYEFYRLAPWPFGSNSKAAAQLEEIRKRDPDRATGLSVSAKIGAKDYAAAFGICDALLAKNPNDYIALYQYGRTAGLCGQNLEQGIARLKKCLALPLPSPASWPHSIVWIRIGSLEEKLNHPAEARAAYEAALKLDPDEKQATDALAKLK